MANSGDSTMHRPMVAGKWIYRTGGMVCRLPLKRLRVSAPADFLRAVERSCDGNATWEDVRNCLIDRWPAEEVDSCMSTLLKQGALVDSSYCLAAQARIGWTPQPIAAPLSDADELYALRHSVDTELTQPRPGIEKLRPRNNPLMDLLLSRGSARTFDDKPLQLQSVVNILWSMYGVLRETEERVQRTVPSGGALYGLRWFMALLRPMEGYPTGLYEVRYHACGVEGGELSLQMREGEANGAWSTLLTPAVLSFAHAVIYPVADIQFIGKKYGNRALTLAMLEAGHALQNGALVAQYEGAATIMRGDTVEVEVLSLLGLADSFYPLPAMVLGSKPSVNQEALAKAAGQVALVRSVPNHSQRLALSTRIAVAGPIRIGRQENAWGLWAAGRSESPEVAVVKAEAEAWERIGWSSPRADLERARFGEVPRAVDPRNLVEYSPAQYSRDEFPYSPFSTRRRYPWLKAERSGTGAEVQIMAQCVYALSSMSPGDVHQPFTNASTSGVAAYTDMSEARHRALVELIERDAFARAWLGRVAPPMVDETGLSSSLQRRLARLRDAGYLMSLHVLPSDHLPVIAVFAQHRTSAFTSLTTAAGFQWQEVVESALSETESRVQQHHGVAPRPPMRVEEVMLATHHGEYFRTKAGFKSADWFASVRRMVSVRGKTSFASNGTQLLDHFQDLGLEVLFCDLTPSGAAINQGRSPLYVARAFAPALIPIWFGHGVEPLGTCERLGVEVEARGIACGPPPIHPCT
ncbi:YcaO-like family protein [Variovorax sp. tm]